MASICGYRRKRWIGPNGRLCAREGLAIGGTYGRILKPYLLQSVFSASERHAAPPDILLPGPLR
jgi:hypothetical protein